MKPPITSPAAAIKGPCQNCPNRRPKCHSECGAYLEYRAKADEVCRTIRLAKMAGTRNEDYEKSRTRLYGA